MNTGEKRSDKTESSRFIYKDEIVVYSKTKEDRAHMDIYLCSIVRSQS